MSLPRSTIAPANSNVWNTSRVLNSEFSDSKTVFTERSLAAAREPAIARTAEPETAAGGTTGGPETIAGGLFILGLFILGFLGFFGGMGCAHRTSGPMTWAFGRRPVCGARLGETFFFIETLGIMFDYTGKRKSRRIPAGMVRPEGQEKNPLFQDVHDRVYGIPRSVGAVEVIAASFLRFYYARQNRKYSPLPGRNTEALRKREARPFGRACPTLHFQAIVIAS